MSQTTDSHADVPAPMAPHKDMKWIGKSVKRVEDPKLLRGLGRYIDDVVLPGMLHAAVLRSPHAHARIVSVDAERARRAPGVVAVLTGPEAAEQFGPLPDSGPAPDKHVWRVLAADKVHYVGEGVAVVVAENRYQAEDARTLIDVTYDVLEPVVDPIAAAEDTGNLVHEALGTNVAYERTFTFGDVAHDFADADLVVRDRLRWGRQTAHPLDTTAAIGDYDAGTGEMVVHTNSISMTWLAFGAAVALGIPSNKLDLRPYISGGSFGSKQFCWRSTVTAAMMSKITGRPVKYVEDRLDHQLNGDQHGSDRYYDVELALMRDGTFRSLKIDCVDDYGAYIQFGVGSHGNALAQVTGPYRITSTEYRVRAVLTNKTQQGAYRGFGADAGNWALERIVDKAAAELGLDPADIRRRNLIPPDAFPYHIPSGNMYDSGNYEPVLDHALQRFDYDGWRRKQEAMRAEGRKIGIGVVTANERSVYGATEFWFWFDDKDVPVKTTSTPEGVSMTVDTVGAVTVTLYSTPFWGNSSDTVAAMLAAEEFDVDPADVSVVHHGTKGGLPAAGPGGSRLTVMLAGAITGASKKIKDKLRRIAAHDMEVDEADLEWVDGGYQVRGAEDSRRSIGDLAMLAYLVKTALPDGEESGLAADFVYDHPHLTMPKPDRSDLGSFYPCVGHACHLVAVEVDEETGSVDILDYVAVHDSGTLVNPRSYDGQIVGGTAQGVGTALAEEMTYDAAGNPLVGTFWDYLIPTALDVPEVNFGHEETPSPITAHGIKGGGEAGRLMAPGALSAAIDDALRDHGVRVTELPATPERIVGWIQGHRG
ncbi:MAG: xanthine dehydrogenase family protein [Pseudonocardia sp.]|uniref:xanthine dehydrogenase family protein molybdopterin-binding subunit n=1 Tax=unclassified Pseudonocardia TaxID=2619320 RepID=UPI000AD94CBE|nr:MULTISPECIES: xanthine dehydrogenase family protein molybdopterin-binding subunit [unclassified Pseudonocardia]MBN9110717.1 xanthine dehydrogenase family protein [Pseudonocardia sp.]